MIIRTKKIFLCVFLIILGIVYLCTNRRTNNENVSLKQLLAAAIRAAELGGFEVVAVHDQMKFKVESKGQTKEGNSICIKRNIIHIFYNIFFIYISYVLPCLM